MHYIAVRFETEMEASEWLRNAEIPPFVSVKSDGHFLDLTCEQGCNDYDHYDMLETLRSEIADEIRNTDN